MSKFQPITVQEAQHLTRRQLLERIQETQAWLDRRPWTDAKRVASRECSQLLYQHLSIGEMLGSTRELILGLRGRSGGYLNERIDGSPPRPPTRIRLSRQHAKPYGCKNVARPGPFGNPFTIAEHGAAAVPMFRELLAHPSQFPAITYPSIQQIRETLEGWDLACWCAIPVGYVSAAAAVTQLHQAISWALRDQDDLCHADVLLRVAAGGEP